MPHRCLWSCRGCCSKASDGCPVWNVQRSSSLPCISKISLPCSLKENMHTWVCLQDSQVHSDKLQLFMILPYKSREQLLTESVQTSAAKMYNRKTGFNAFLGGYGLKDSTKGIMDPHKYRRVHDAFYVWINCKKKVLFQLWCLCEMTLWKVCTYLDFSALMDRNLSNWQTDRDRYILSMDSSPWQQEGSGVKLPTQKLGDDSPVAQFTLVGCDYCIVGSNIKPEWANYTAKKQLLWFRLGFVCLFCFSVFCFFVFVCFCQFYSWREQLVLKSAFIEQYGSRKL